MCPENLCLPGGSQPVLKHQHLYCISMRRGGQCQPGKRPIHQNRVRHVYLWRTGVRRIPYLRTPPRPFCAAAAASMKPFLDTPAPPILEAKLEGVYGQVAKVGYGGSPGYRLTCVASITLSRPSLSPLTTHPLRAPDTCGLLCATHAR